MLDALDALLTRAANDACNIPHAEEACRACRGGGVVVRAAVVCGAELLGPGVGLARVTSLDEADDLANDGGTGILRRVEAKDEVGGVPTTRARAVIDGLWERAWRSCEWLCHGGSCSGIRNVSTKRAELAHETPR